MKHNISSFHSVKSQRHTHGYNTGTIEPPPDLLRPSPPSGANFPILAISIVGILATAIFLLSYYVFVIKCCLSWHRSDVLSRLSRSRRRWGNTGGHTLASSYLSSTVDRGLDESAIQAIPTLRFRRGEQQNTFHECAVCLNEFQEEERIRVLPHCFHVFHIDCIDTWLQTHANCPLCRTRITSTSLTPAMPTSVDQGDSVAIDVRDEESDQTPRIEASSYNVNSATDSSVGKERKLHQVSSFGDECIDLRGNNVQFAVQSMRRSFSMDSSSDRAVQEIMWQNPHFRDAANGEGTSTGSGRPRRSFFSFNGHSRTSKRAVLPVYQNEQ